MIYLKYRVTIARLIKHVQIFSRNMDTLHVLRIWSEGCGCADRLRHLCFVSNGIRCHSMFDVAQV